jgi:hypothetical protein
MTKRMKSVATPYLIAATISAALGFADMMQASLAGIIPLSRGCHGSAFTAQFVLWFFLQSPYIFFG